MVRDELPKKPTERIDLVIPCILAVEVSIEPLIVSREEFERLKRKKNPAIIDAISNGVILAKSGSEEEYPRTSLDSFK